jgi:Trk K+ transport system NAD-binding subunit
VFGMGRVGTGVYDTLLQQYGESLLGIDYDPNVIKKHIAEGRNVLVGDATDYDFWERLRPGAVKLIILDMPNVKEALAAVRMIKSTGYKGLISAAVQHNDSIQQLRDAGVDSVFNIYATVGATFANHVCEQLCVSLDEIPG